MDVFDKDKRSRVMAKVKNKNTKPELLVRSLLHRMGYRFRIHRKDLPGNPDITLPKYKAVIFVHGCFWHGHEGCPKAKRPQSNMEFWDEKLNENIDRDKKVVYELERMGWRVLVIWTCEINDVDALSQRVESFMQNQN
jgi:DNA mismatch endonuclease (patch repair protein)